MGKRYYCDYCHKTFIEDIDTRRKHMNGFIHQKLRNDHYLSFRAPQTLLNEEIVKQPCKRFFQSGSCQYLRNCKYTHYTQEQLWEIKLEVTRLEYERKQQRDKNSEVPTLETWLETYYKEKIKMQEKKKNENIWWNYPEKLESKLDLPASLLKFDPDNFEECEFETWGTGFDKYNY